MREIVLHTHFVVESIYEIKEQMFGLNMYKSRELWYTTEQNQWLESFGHSILKSVTNEKNTNRKF